MQISLLAERNANNAEEIVLSAENGGHDVVVVVVLPLELRWQRCLLEDGATRRMWMWMRLRLAPGRTGPNSIGAPRPPFEFEIPVDAHSLELA